MYWIPPHDTWFWCFNPLISSAFYFVSPDCTWFHSILTLLTFQLLFTYFHLISPDFKSVFFYQMVPEFEAFLLSLYWISALYLILRHFSWFHIICSCCHIILTWFRPICTWFHLISLHFTSLSLWFHLVVTWCHLIPLDNSWNHSIMTWFHLILLDFTFCDISLYFTAFLLDFTSHLLGFNWYHLILQVYYQIAPGVLTLLLNLTSFSTDFT